MNHGEPGSKKLAGAWPCDMGDRLPVFGDDMQKQKRKTKIEREAEEKKKLHARLMDFVIGANGGCSPEDIDGKTQLGSLEVAAFGRFLRCIDLQLLSVNREYLIKPHNFSKFDTLESAVDFLFDHGIRADSTPDDTE